MAAAGGPHRTRALRGGHIADSGSSTASATELPIVTQPEAQTALTTTDLDSDHACEHPLHDKTWGGNTDQRASDGKPWLPLSDLGTLSTAVLRRPLLNDHRRRLDGVWHIRRRRAAQPAGRPTR